MPTPLVRRVRAVALLAALAGAAACARAAAPAGDEAVASGAPRKHANVITAAEIAEARVTTAYHAVEVLRPTFLRGLRSNIQPVVYVNGQRWGGLEALRRVTADDVDTIRRLSASEAHTIYGPGLLGGVIDVVTRHGRGP
jgi:hypothetical protein